MPCVLERARARAPCSCLLVRYKGVRALECGRLAGSACSVCLVDTLQRAHCVCLVDTLQRAHCVCLLLTHFSAHTACAWVHSRRARGRGLVGAYMEPLGCLFPWGMCIARQKQGVEGRGSGVRWPFVVHVIRGTSNAASSL